ncbi:MAG TPA: NPCBM/NEW2 domain-containing protein [Vicinamibacteria bacterium]|nr:NPCBM/NEW2 domain-containing protein [Vicinamibacteria bacterium]
MIALLAASAVAAAVEAGPVTPWPRPIPARLRPPGRDEVLVTTLGEVETPLAEGTFDPVADRLTLKDGRVIEHYYRDTLKVPFYAPVDKTIFRVPPSGWCSWYYYYQEISSDEILANARWIARHLKPYGARYVQVDDGWQGTGHGKNDNRDWTTIDARFRARGMDGLAREIRALGLEAGIWLAPHGQSNERVARDSGVFLWKPDGTTASDSWEGTYLLDPTAAGAADYLRRLFRTLRDWGYTYYKIDGQTVVLREYAKAIPYMRNPPAGKPEDVAARVYRDTLPAIREAIGPESYLLSCWGIPLPAMGLVNGSRTGGDVVQGLEGLVYAAAITQEWNFLHNVAWYSDPDVLEVRPPLSDGIARAWATVFALTGQALMSSDRLTDLPESRVEILRRVYPAVDIRPLDLYRPDQVLKPVVDLKVRHLGRSYDVVGVFNYDGETGANRLVSWSALGLSPGAYHVYDFWSGTYLGAWEQGVFVDVPPADVRVLTLVRATDRPVLLSTSRHITQGWIDLLDLRQGGDAHRPTMAGRSRLVAGDPYRLTVALPRAAPSFRLAAARARGSRPVRVSWESHQGYATVTLTSEVAQAVEWELAFEPAEPYLYPVESPAQVQAWPHGLAGAELRWPAQYHVKAGYVVEVDGRPVGHALSPHAALRDLQPGRTYRVAVRSVWSDGSASPKPAEVTFTVAAPRETGLSELPPVLARHDWRNAWRPVARDRSVDGRTLRVAGRTYPRGLGTHAGSEVRYDLAGAFRRFTAQVGIDDEVRPEKPNQAVFEVWGDGRSLWSSGPVTHGAAPVMVEVDVTGVRELVLKVLPGTDGAGNDHADWLVPRLIP